MLTYGASHSVRRTLTHIFTYSPVLLLPSISHVNLQLLWIWLPLLWPVSSGHLSFHLAPHKEYFQGSLLHVLHKFIWVRVIVTDNILCLLSEKSCLFLLDKSTCNDYCSSPFCLRMKDWKQLISLMSSDLCTHKQLCNRRLIWNVHSAPNSHAREHTRLQSTSYNS